MPISYRLTYCIHAHTHHTGRTCLAASCGGTTTKSARDEATDPTLHHMNIAHTNVFLPSYMSHSCIQLPCDLCMNDNAIRRPLIAVHQVEAMGEQLFESGRRHREGIATSVSATRAPRFPEGSSERWSGTRSLRRM